MRRRTFLKQSAALVGMETSYAMSALRQPPQGRKEFEAYQARRRRELWDLLGDLPERHKPAARLLKSDKHKTFTLEHLELNLNGAEAVPAYLLLPHKRAKSAAGLL